MAANDERCGCGEPVRIEERADGTFKVCGVCGPVEKKVCVCECGGTVWGTGMFGRLWTGCDRCSPVQRINVNELKVRGLVNRERPVRAAGYRPEEPE